MEESEEESPIQHNKLIEVIELGMGNSFGELALINNKPRLGTVRCNSDCHFAVLNKGLYSRVLSKIEIKNQNRITDFFKGLPYFRNWSRAGLLKLYLVFNRK